MEALPYGYYSTESLKMAYEVYWNQGGYFDRNSDGYFICVCLRAGLRVVKDKKLLNRVYIFEFENIESFQ